MTKTHDTTGMHFKNMNLLALRISKNTGSRKKASWMVRCKINQGMQKETVI